MARSMWLAAAVGGVARGIDVEFGRHQVGVVLGGELLAGVVAIVRA